MRSTKLETSGILVNALCGFGSFKRAARIDPLKLYERLEIDGFLALLNRKEPVKLSLPPQRPTDIPRLSVTPVPSTGEILRVWVDEWLNSGRDETGGENPKGRTFDKAKSAGYAAYEYSERGNLRLLPYRNELAPILEKKSEPERFEFGVKVKREEFARGQLVLFLLSDLKFKLAKCRKEDCGTYFLLKHWNRLYQGGTLCDSCKRSRSLDSAKSATAHEREHARAELHSLAAKRFVKQISTTPAWYLDIKLKGAIVEFLNARLERSESLRAVYMNGITGKWVANPKNWKQIEAALKEGK